MEPPLFAPRPSRRRARYESPPVAAPRPSHGLPRARDEAEEAGLRTDVRHPALRDHSVPGHSEPAATSWSIPWGSPCAHVSGVVADALRGSHPRQPFQGGGNATRRLDLGDRAKRVGSPVVANAGPGEHEAFLRNHLLNVIHVQAHRTSTLCHIAHRLGAGPFSGAGSMAGCHTRTGSGPQAPCPSTSCSRPPSSR
jgi:hypothetical protein